MEIESLYRDYIQKSRLFLYPALNIKRGVSVTPVQTYLRWQGRYTLDDNKFIVVYHLRDDRDFRIFEDVKLKGNPLFHEFLELENDLGAYVFDMSEMAEDFQKIVNGQYSALSEKQKNCILRFFKSQTAHYGYIQSYLNPGIYYEMYSDLLNVDVNLLKSVGELCNYPDHIKETLKTAPKIMESEEIPLLLTE
jgi:hypothetical protein